MRLNAQNQYACRFGCSLLTYNVWPYCRKIFEIISNIRVSKELNFCCLFIVSSVVCGLFYARSLFCCAVLCVLSSFAIISQLVALLLLPSWCHVAVYVLCPFLMVPWLVCSV